MYGSYNSMNMAMTNIITRLAEVNGIVSGYDGGAIPFEQAYALARFYYDFQDTNALIADAEAMVGENPEQLKEIALSLKAETATLLNNIGRLDGVDFRGISARPLNSYKDVFLYLKNVKMQIIFDVI